MIELIVELPTLNIFDHPNDRKFGGPLYVCASIRFRTNEIFSNRRTIRFIFTILAMLAGVIVK